MSGSLPRNSEDLLTVGYAHLVGLDLGDAALPLGNASVTPDQLAAANVCSGVSGDTCHGNSSALTVGIAGLEALLVIVLGLGICGVSGCANVGAAVLVEGVGTGGQGLGIGAAGSLGSVTCNEGLVGNDRATAQQMQREDSRTAQTRYV